MLSIKALNRYLAFGIHLAISASLALSLSAVVFLLWYPGLYAYASNVTNIFLLLMLVDVVMGPVITLIIYNPQKKELKRDLSIVGLMQVLALLYGLHTVFIVRPVYLVFNAGQFDLTYAHEISEKNREKAALAEYRSLPYFGPRLVAVKLPEDERELMGLIMSSVSGGPDVKTLPQYFVPYKNLSGGVLSAIQPLDKLKPLNRDRLQQLDEMEKKYQAAGIAVGYLPLKARYHNLTVIVNRSSADILEVSELKPWP
ncbi:MAG: hypothetical protein HYZ65_09605 [Burkholderiales bacterium]|nr:hypothetical protein [Burkholderiales bacterium]